MKDKKYQKERILLALCNFIVLKKKNKLLKK